MNAILERTRPRSLTLKRVPDGSISICHDPSGAPIIRKPNVMNYSLDELQNMVRQHEQDKRIMALRRAAIPKPARRKPVAMPFAPLAATSNAKALLTVSAVACHTFVALSTYDPDENGITYVKRADIAGKIRRSPATVSRAVRELISAGLVAKVGYGIVLRKRD